jgi:hypothetical protein
MPNQITGLRIILKDAVNMMRWSAVKPPIELVTALNEYIASLEDYEMAEQRSLCYSKAKEYDKNNNKCE